MSGANRLGWLRDIREIVRSESLDWDELVRRSDRARVAPMIGQVLDRSRHLVAAAVPDDVASRLCSNSLLKIRSWLDRQGRGAGLPDYYCRGLPVQVSGDGLAPTCKRVVVRLKEHRKQRDERWNVGDPDGLLYWNSPSGGDEGRNRYIAMAAREE